ncbi:ABC transporter ATP-binding protein [Micrococcus endophyticus]|uniref:ABC transporter ATP-binding protein n=1 Tax=Micrococcus endophyticus TaxID=455343 RepID=UPI00200502AD|nr:ABC transporter ATP-binding protein [Micrococcus endophyticus]MCK6091789.1 ABC transporter ATP-binding protein [Micrococcus endophyticus]
MTEAPIISVEGLVCRYGDFTAVKGIDFDVRAGELFALLGTNGAGKTTTLETVEGFRAPSEGKVTVAGYAPHRHRGVRRRMGIMLQDEALADALTCSEMLRLCGRLSGRTDDVDRLLDDVQLDHRADAVISQLSGGERRRLDFAIALWGNPEIVILDEPTTGLDPQSRESLWRLVDMAVAEGTTVVLTTHYLEEAETHASRVAIMHGGQIAEAGSVEEVRSQHGTVLSVEADSDGPRGWARAGRRWQWETRDVEPALRDLLEWAHATGNSLDSLEVDRPTLSRVFHEIARKGDADA